jgi:hypothetical protein
VQGVPNNARRPPHLSARSLGMGVHSRGGYRLNTLKAETRHPARLGPGVAFFVRIASMSVRVRSRHLL